MERRALIRAMVDSAEGRGSWRLGTSVRAIEAGGALQKGRGAHKGEWNWGCLVWAAKFRLLRPSGCAGSCTNKATVCTRVPRRALFSA
eukprot:scaffold198541_cov19-Tisochrysis_lutea.AAC.1